ncbi:MAG: acyltransferase [Gammaproteobacteria bacterium]|nr:acyltransferase [Gammaproteobacteria bacterium]
MKSGENRVFGLDVLRAFAVLFVVWGHGVYLIGHSVSKSLYMLPVFDGVTIFFVLSGFLIGRILLRTVTKDEFDGRLLVEFWVRRWFRTLPNYFAVLIFLIISFDFLGLPKTANPAPYFFFLQNIVSPHPDFFSEAWSLAVEEWFYLVIPIPLYLSTRLRNINRHRLILFLIVAVIVLVTAFRLYRAHHFNYTTLEAWDGAQRKTVLTRLDSLMFGVFGAYLSLYRERFWRDFAGKGLVLGIALLLIDKFYLTHSMFYVNYVNRRRHLANAPRAFIVAAHFRVCSSHIHVH